MFVKLGDGDDRYVATGAPLATALVDGGPGNDVLDTGPGGLGALGFVTGLVAGGPGDDRIDLGAGDDLVSESGDAATGTENNGGGAFSSSALPNLAQISPTKAIVLEDVDGDGHLDVILAGNLYDAEPNTPKALPRSRGSVKDFD